MLPQAEFFSKGGNMKVDLGAKDVYPYIPSGYNSVVNILTKEELTITIKSKDGKSKQLNTILKSALKKMMDNKEVVDETLLPISLLLSPPLSDINSMFMIAFFLGKIFSDNEYKISVTKRKLTDKEMESYISDPFHKNVQLWYDQLLITEEAIKNDTGLKKTHPKDL